MENTMAVLKAILDSGSGLLGILMGWGLDNIPYVAPWYESLEFQAKRLVLFVAAFAIAGLAAGGLVYLGAPNDPDMWLSAVLAGALAYMGSQAYHTYSKYRELKSTNS